MHHMPDTHQAYDIFFEKQGFTKVLMYLLESQMGTNVYRMDKHCTRTPSTVCGRSTRSARPRGLGGDFEFLPLKSPRNPITPIETSRVATLHPGLYKRLREGARRVIGATAKPLYAIDGKAEGLDRRSPSRPPSSREGDRPQTVEGVRTPCVERRSRPPSSRKNLFQTSYASYASYARHTSGI